MNQIYKITIKNSIKFQKSLICEIYNSKYFFMQGLNDIIRKFQQTWKKH